MTASPDNTAPIVGIDLGTTNSLVAYADEKGPRILVDAHGTRMLPSVVRFNADGRAVEVGERARRQAILEPEWTVSSVKRLM
ncbi:MAG: Hsp70 family protein, partial [Phycisphaerales bacterium]|nr:Hsp70 family protein [Phycisphaerales bacterium]